MIAELLLLSATLVSQSVAEEEEHKKRSKEASQTWISFSLDLAVVTAASVLDGLGLFLSAVCFSFSALLASTNQREDNELHCGENK